MPFNDGQGGRTAVIATPANPTESIICTRRKLLLGGLSGLTFIGAANVSKTLGAPCSARNTLVGAIRWDGWYAPDSAIGRALEKTLSPEQYRYRLPFFAHIAADNSVQINGFSHEIMDKEISYALEANLSFWAFDAYPETDSMSNALRLYLSSSMKQCPNFCMLSGLDIFLHSDILNWHVELMKNGRYQTVIDRRPLYFLGFIKDELVRSGWGDYEGLRSAIDRFRLQVTKAFLKNPYIVLLGTRDIALDQIRARKLACDALSAYAVNSNVRRGTFMELEAGEKALWSEQASTGLAVVPIVSLGFDRRPRIQNPVPWESPATAPDALNVYYETATVNQVEESLTGGVRWLLNNPSATPSKVVLVYAWNENDEGGWLIPTFPDNTQRIVAAGRALRALQLGAN